MTLRVDLIFLPGAETSGFKSKSILGPQDVDPAGTMISYLYSSLSVSGANLKSISFSSPTFGLLEL